MTTELPTTGGAAVRSSDLLDAETVADAERFQWLIKQGLAWRDCYDRDWLPGEWLYSAQDARHFVDKAMAQASNDQAHLSAPGGRVERNQKEQ